MCVCVCVYVCARVRDLKKAPGVLSHSNSGLAGGGKFFAELSSLRGWIVLGSG